MKLLNSEQTWGKYFLRRNKLDLQEDENLAEEVRKYPCLYNKSSKDHKSKTAVENAWKQIESDLGLEKGISNFSKLDLM